MNTVELCPCGTNKIFDKCCGLFLNGGEHAKTAVQLMRSRYTAHALLSQGMRGYGEYLVSTWLMAVELGLTAASFAEHKVNWQKLEVLNSLQKGDHGEVEFKAYFYSDENPELQVHHEHSLFKRLQGIWYYVEAKQPEYKT